MKPNASTANIHRWYEGYDRNPVYAVTWENTVEDEDAEDVGHAQRFSTVDAALAFTRKILTTTVELT